MTTGNHTTPDHQWAMHGLEKGGNSSQSQEYEWLLALLIPGQLRMQSTESWATAHLTKHGAIAQSKVNSHVPSSLTSQRCVSFSRPPARQQWPFFPSCWRAMLLIHVPCRWMFGRVVGGQWLHNCLSKNEWYAPLHNHCVLWHPRAQSW